MTTLAFDGLRAAARKLQSLAPDDRRWLLERLDAGARRRLASVLDEVVDPDAGASAATRPADEAAAAAAALEAERVGGTEVHGRLNAASPPRVSQLLADEPDWILQAVLGAASWRWTEAFVSTLSTERRLRLARDSAAGGLAPEALRELCRILADILDEESARQSASFAGLLAEARSSREAFGHGGALWRWIRQWMP
jgi:hypothetical protein